jgi:hypothetical protein
MRRHAPTSFPRSKYIEAQSGSHVKTVTNSPPEIAGFQALSLDISPVVLEMHSCQLENKGVKMEVFIYVGGIVLFFLFGVGAANGAKVLCKSIFSPEAYHHVGDPVLGGSFAIGLIVFLVIADKIETEIRQRKTTQAEDGETLEQNALAAGKACPPRESIIRENLRLFLRYVLPVVALVLPGSFAFASVFTWKNDLVWAWIAAVPAGVIGLGAVSFCKRNKKNAAPQAPEEQ